MDKELQTLLDGARCLWQEIQRLKDEQRRGAKTERVQLSVELVTAINAIARRAGCLTVGRDWNSTIEYVDRRFPGWRGIDNPVSSDRHRQIASSLKEDLYA